MTLTKTLSAAAAALLLLAACSDDNDTTTSSAVTLEKLGAYESGLETGSEISAYDAAGERLFTTNGALNQIDVIDLSDPASPTLLTSLDLSAYGAGVQSVAVKNGAVAVAVGAADKVGERGSVVVFNAADYSLLSRTRVGYLPDMVTFDAAGTKVIVANEGEPDGSSGSYVDVAGSVGIVTLASATTADNAAGYAESDFSGIAYTAAADGTAVRLGGTPSNDYRDIEPEYIAVSGTTAYVTLQENNAVAVVDISGAAPVITSVKSLGRKDYATQNTIDIEEEGTILMKNYPGLYGLYQPDTIATYSVGGSTYLVTANEGDGREYLDSLDNDVFVDEAKISKLDLDAAIAGAYAGENDLKVMTDLGDTDGDGFYEELYAYGARSFSIWDTAGNLVWDSGDALSKLTAEHEPALFNQDDGTMDGRSGNKGVEPEALAVGTIDAHTYAFVGFERQSAIVIYDITNPTAPRYCDYVITHADGDVSPEGMLFVPASASPSGKNLLVVSNEVSGSTAVYEIKPKN